MFNETDLRLFKCIGSSFIFVGEIENAHKYAALAQELVADLGSWALGKLRWLQGRIATNLKQYDQAQSLFREAVKIYTPVSPLATALCATELTRSLLLGGKNAEAYRTASTMARFIEPLENRSPLAAAAAIELVLCGQEGRGITINLINRISGILEKEQSRPQGENQPFGGVTSMRSP